MTAIEITADILAGIRIGLFLGAPAVIGTFFLGYWTGKRYGK
jgi:H+/gluconate symporter-like permease